MILLLIIIYVSFIGLGLPDGILGSAWPIMHKDLLAHVDYAGYISMLIAVGTTISSVNSERILRRLGTAKLVVISTALTAVSLFAFSFAPNVWVLFLLAIPYGLGAGSIDAALNSYVALNYRSHHMSWLHCFWGVGASLGPYIMGTVLLSGGSWNRGYRVIGSIQLVIVTILLFSLPIWKRARQNESANIPSEDSDGQSPARHKIKDILALPAVKYSLLSFFAYIGVETTTFLWFSSFLVIGKGVSPELAAAFASVFFVGMTAGRGMNGFLTFKFSDKQLIRGGYLLIAFGILILIAPGPSWLAIAGVALVGLGCAPIYPCVIHQTPEVFGKHLVHAVVGLQMAAAYMGGIIFPPVFGLLARNVDMRLFPYYIGVIFLLMVFSYERVLKIKGI